MKKLIFAFALLAGCSPPPEQPDLQSYGVVFPVCILQCRANITSANLAQGASQSTTNQSSSQTGTP
jgi:hypothetical protein